MKEGSIRIAIFASGTGSNASEIIRYFKNHPRVNVAALFSNNENSGAITIAKSNGIPAIVFTKKELEDQQLILDSLKQLNIHWIVLAGFLLKIPLLLVREYNHKIINIHPALLPDFGGKGMYGMHVHRAVRDSNVSITGITIHFVNEHYDEGDIIFQKETSIALSDTPELIAEKVLQLEHYWYPRIIEQEVLKY